MLVESISEENFETKRIEGADRVRKKLKEIDRQAKNNSINWNLFFDPTVWANKVLKDKQSKPIVLRGFQDKILNDKHPTIIVAGANQVGKTYSIAIKAIHHALHVNNASVLIISRSEQQAFFILDEIKLLMKAANIAFEDVIGKVENRTELHVNNANKLGVSIIRCLPPTQSVYAYPATLIICDEIGYWEIDGMTQAEFFYKVVMSRINETKNWKKNCICGVERCGHFKMGQIIGISATNGKQGIMWNLWNNADNHQYRYNFLANPSNSYEEFIQWKDDPPEGYTADMFASVYDASFSSASGGFITQSEWNDAVRDYMVMPPLGVSMYLGGDFAGEDTKGRDVDQHSLIGVIPYKEEEKEFIKVVFSKDYKLRTKKEVVYEDIKQLRIAKFAYDKVGVGDSVKNDLKDRNILSEYQIESLTYSLPNKSEVYYNLKHLFEQRKIIVPNLPELKKQLLGLRFERPEGSIHIKVHHATEGLHDDLADALANACYAARLKGREPYIGIATKGTISHNLDTNKLNTLICPECEKIDYKGMAGYYKGHSPNKLNFEKVNCPRHKVIETTI